MKKLLLIIAVMVLSISVKAQTDQPTHKETEESKKDKTEKEYCCPKCDYCDANQGKCPAHNCDLVKEGMYCCGNCNTTSKKACKCSKCGKEMKKMNRKKKKEHSEKQ